MIYKYNAPESQNDVRYEYHWEILKNALELTTKEYGPFEMVKSKPMSENRQSLELINNSGELNVMYLGTKPEFEKNLYGIHIPVDKNLGGYCVFLIDKKNKSLFDNIRSLDDLKKFKFGLGKGWLDVSILEYNKFNVITGSSYDGLFEMLLNNRFDIFLRAAVEVLDEVKLREKSFPDLYIEDNICLYYPLPMYFWFPKTLEGKKLAERAEKGMRLMIKNGLYDKIFLKYQAHKIEKLKLNKRKIFKIENPLLGPETPFWDKALWYYPK